MREDKGHKIEGIWIDEAKYFEPQLPVMPRSWYLAVGFALLMLVLALSRCTGGFGTDG